ncbi:MAG: hypothetical protein KG003_08620 [Bacteroidetes bacterium]|nr:hypothetical protein [Bacteroidota bacterium]
MKKLALFICIFCLKFFSALGQVGISKNQYTQIFNVYQLKQAEFRGLFDTSGSIFYMHADTAIQSPFDSNCLLSKGKTWHLGQVVSFTNYLTIDTVYQVLPTEDSAMTENHWALALPEVQKKGFGLWKCEGEFTINENPDEKYSGKFLGTFTIYFLFHQNQNKILPLNSEKSFGKEPAYLFSGFWKPYLLEKNISIAFFIANTLPKVLEDRSVQLPDLRFQSDGSSSFSNIVTFPPEMVLPPLNWYQ